MKIFLSWHGQHSKMIAEALNNWLQRTIQAVKPFFSPEIEKGAKWSNELDNALEGTKFGIVCLTPDNLDSKWIHYEAGALSKTKDALIYTFLVGLKPLDVGQPLGKYQHTVAEKEDVFNLVKSINSKLKDSGSEPLSEIILREIFDESWSKLDTKIKEVEKALSSQSNKNDADASEPVRSQNDMLNEILELLRSQQRYNSQFPLFDYSLKRKYSDKTYTEIIFSTENFDGMTNESEFVKQLSVLLSAKSVVIFPDEESTEKSKIKILLETNLDAPSLAARLIEVSKKLGFKLNDFDIINPDGSVSHVEIPK